VKKKKKRMMKVGFIGTLVAIGERIVVVVVVVDSETQHNTGADADVEVEAEDNHSIEVDGRVGKHTWAESPCSSEVAVREKKTRSRTGKPLDTRPEACWKSPDDELFHGTTVRERPGMPSSKSRKERHKSPKNLLPGRGTFHER
jgi:hypothetical protein